MAITSFAFILLVQLCSIINGKSLPKFPAILIFGDSTVDTGNNNYISTIFQGNHRPYGENFPGRIPTGRFSDGKLVPDFLASMLGLKEYIPPFLQPYLSSHDLLTGVSFASAGSGYDDLTTAASKAIPMSQQIKYFEHYIEQLQVIVGEEKAQKLVSGALVVISAGTNDFIFNFYDIPTRRHQFNITGYQDFLQSLLQNFVEVITDKGPYINLIHLYLIRPPTSENNLSPTTSEALFNHTKIASRIKKKYWLVVSLLHYLFRICIILVVVRCLLLGFLLLVVFQYK